MDYFTFSVGRKFRRDSAGSFLFRVTRRIDIRLLERAEVI